MGRTTRNFNTDNNRSCDEDSLTPLHLAVKNRRMDITCVLVEHGTDPNARDKDKLTDSVAFCRGGRKSGPHMSAS